MIQLFLLLLSSNALAGNELGNGGDLAAQEFTAAGRQLLEKLKAQPDPRIPDVAKFEEALNKVKVNSADSLTLHGAEVDAINYPDTGHIDVNRKRWQDSDPSKRASLVLHEYLGILRVDDSHYEVSSSYADAFTKAEKKHRFQAELSSQFGGGTMWDSHFISKQPGIGAFIGVNLTENSTLGLNGNFQKFVKRFDNNENEKQFVEASLAYRYWLSSSISKIRPYVQAALGYAASKETYVSHLTGEWADTNYVYNYESPGSETTAQAAVGARYKMTNEIGIDFSGHVHRIGFRRWDKATLYFAQVGLDIAI